MGVHRNGVKVLLKHDGDIVEKVMTKAQFESFIKSSILDGSEADKWMLLGKKACIIDKHGNEIVTADKIEEYWGFEKEKATPEGQSDYFLNGPDLMDVIRTHQAIDTPKGSAFTKKRIRFAAPDTKSSGQPPAVPEIVAASTSSGG